MVMTRLGVDEAKAKDLLTIHKSVRLAINTHKI